MPLLEPREHPNRSIEVTGADAGFHPLRLDAGSERLDQARLDHGRGDLGVLASGHGRISGGKRGESTKL